MNSILKINDIRFWVNLGCTKEERSLPQIVSIDIELIFAKPPKGVESDNLNETVCYSKLVESVFNSVKNKEFNLIESLAGKIYDKVLQQLNNQDVSINIVVHKTSKQVNGVHGNVSFSYGK